MTTTTPNELHVVFGNAPVGLSVIDELLARGKRVRLVTRSGNATVPAEVEVVKGDATDLHSTRQVCQGATVVYNCAGPRDYHKWPEQFPPIQAGVLAGAAANDAKLVVMENLYMYGPHGGQPMTEDMPYNGKGPRSSTRAQMAHDLMSAHTSGKVRAVSARASDFFGPRTLNSTMGEQPFRAALAGKAAQVLINADLPRTYTYVPDIGKALVMLGEHDEAFGQAWHIPSPQTVTTREFLTIVYEEAGHPLKLSVIPPLMIRVVSLFVPRLRGIEENFYQFSEPYIVDASKFKRAFGDIATPLREAIRQTVAWYRAHPAP